jgi:dimethylglycine dehydrogenase
LKTHARLVVIGGGIMGCSLLYHLTRLGWRDVVLIEKNELTAGSTWHAAGLCTHFAHNLATMQMRAYSVQLYKRELAADTGRPVGFHQCGALRITNSPARLDEFRYVRALGRFAGLEFHLLSPSELQALHPLADSSNLLAALYEPWDGYVDPSQATHAMAAGARDAGAEIYRHVTVERIERTAEGEWCVHTPAGSVRCEIIVNAAGTWAREIGAMMGVDVPIVPMLHQYVVTDRLQAVAALERELPVIRDPQQSWYLRQEGLGLIVGPYERGGQPWGVDGIPQHFGMELLPPDLARIESILLEATGRVPALAEAGIKRIVNGPITFTPDAGPLVGPACGLPNAWLLAGSSMGIMEGGGAGKFLAEWISAGEPPMDALAVDPRRFGDYADRDYRVAKAVECFAHQYAIHFPYEERPAGRPKRKSATYQTLLEAGAVFGCVNGWERANWFASGGQAAPVPLTFRQPEWFTRVGEECATVRDRVGLTDMSHLSKFAVRGRDAPQFMASLGANQPPARIGGIVLTHALTRSGGVRSEFTVTRLAEEHYYLTSAAAAELHDFDLLRAHACRFSGVTVTNESTRLGVLAIAGPHAREVLAKLTEADLSNSAFPWMSARNILVAGRTVRALRVAYVGELGWELHCDADCQRDLFRELMRSGAAFELSLFGAYAMNSMRLEKAYRAWGSDLTTERTPIEAGLMSFVRPGEREFEGREALASHAARPHPMRMVLLELTGGSLDPFYGHPVLCGGRAVGIVTSGSYGHRTGCRLALAYLTEGWEQQSGSPLEVQVLDETCSARILPRAPYDPGNLRPRS